MRPPGHSLPTLGLQPGPHQDCAMLRGSGASSFIPDRGTTRECVTVVTSSTRAICLGWSGVLCTPPPHSGDLKRMTGQPAVTPPLPPRPCVSPQHPPSVFPDISGALLCTGHQVRLQGLAGEQDKLDPFGTGVLVLQESLGGQLTSSPPSLALVLRTPGDHLGTCCHGLTVQRPPQSS